MNIWYLSAYDQPRGQSSRTYDFSLELVKRGHKVTMFTNSYNHWTNVDCLTTNEKWRIEEIDGIRVVWLRTFPYTGSGWRRGVNMLSNMWATLRVVKILIDKPDVVIGPSVPLGTGWVASKIANMKRAAFVFEVRDVWPIGLVNDGGLSKYNPVYFIFRIMEKKLYKKASRISSALPFLFEHVKQSGSDPNKITWIPNGVDLSKFQNKSNYFGGNSKLLVVMYVGGFGNAHDVMTIVKAAILLNKSGNNFFRFILVGDGIKKQQCKLEAATNKLTNIEFRDTVPKEEIPKLQSESDILLACLKNSDIYKFGFNLNKLYVYFASVRPVILSVKQQNNPVAESGGGISILPEDPYLLVQALIKLQELTPEKRIEIGKLGQKYVKDKFSIDRLGDEMEKLLINALKIKL